MVHRNDRRKVLVLLHPDNFVEVYGDNLDVHVQNVPHIPGDRPILSEQEIELLVEKWLDENVPRRHRKLMAPGRREAVAILEVITPTQIAQRQFMAEVVGVQH